MENQYTQWTLAIDWGRGHRFPLSLEWSILDNPISIFWLKLFHNCLSQNLPLKSRYVGFLNGPRNKEFIGGLLNECIDTINRDGRYLINQKYRGEINQKLLNEIHHHFTVLIGNEAFKTDFWIKSNQSVRSAVCGLNDYVHELESWDRASVAAKGEIEREVAFVTSEFFEAKGIEIKNEWNKFFSLNGNFGDLTLHYDQIGKTWLEVLIDQDMAASKDKIRPLSILTGSFNINFFETTHQELVDTVKDYAKLVDVDLNDKSLRLGQCCIGHLKNEMDNKRNFITHLSKRLDISRIVLKKNGQIVLSKDISRTKERYFYEE